MKQLTDRQIELIKYPKERGKTKKTSSDNYSAIYDNTSSAIFYVKSIIELLPYFEKHSEDFTKSKDVCGCISFELLEVILKGVFPIDEQIAASLDDKIHFDLSKRNMNKVSSIAYLFKFSSDYLLQVFPQKEYKHLHPRIDELVKDLKGMLNTIMENQELKKQLEEYRKHFEYFEPMGLSVYDRSYHVACLYCRSTNLNKTLKEAIESIKHTPKCIAEKKYDSDSQEWEKWYKVKYPKRLLLTWDERKKFDELLKNQ